MNDDRRRLDDIVAAADEVTKALSSDTTDEFVDIPWRALVGMRDRTIHRYPEVDLDVLWDTMEHDLPHLEGQIRQHLERHQNLGTPEPDDTD